MSEYVECWLCGGFGDDHDYPGLVRGLTLAAPRGIPFGTALCIEGIGLRIVQDRGGSIAGNRVDVYVRDPCDAPGHYELSHQLALELARHRLRAWVVGGAADVVTCETGGI